MVDAPGRTGPLLSVEKLAVGIRGERGTFEAISDVDLVIEQGEVLGLVGESGCGKSITATAVMGLLPHPVARIVRGVVGSLRHAAKQPSVRSISHVAWSWSNQAARC